MIDFCAGLAGMPDELVAALSLPLVDHHVHGCFAGAVNRAAFESSLNEASTDPIPGFMTQFDSQVGLALRRWCGPMLGLDEHVPADSYWARRAELSSESVARVLLPAAGVSRWLVDTGFGADVLCSPGQLAEWSGGAASEVLRLETLAEALLAEGVQPQLFARDFRARLADRGPDVVAAKSIVAYRCGFDIDWSRPADSDVSAVVSEWSAELGDAPPRLTSPLLAAFGIHAAADAGLPIQLHAGLGDRDLDLHRVNPLLLLPLLRQPGIRRVPVLLLHCYPFHREAGYLAQAFDNVHMDVGLAVHHLGARSASVLGEALELAPFAKLLYSSDAYGLPEFHLLGSVLWRRGMARVLGRWVREGDWSLADAARVVGMIGSGNAERVYGGSAESS